MSQWALPGGPGKSTERRVRTRESDQRPHGDSFRHWAARALRVVSVSVPRTVSYSVVFAAF